MEDQDKSKDALIIELTQMRQRVSELEESLAAFEWRGEAGQEAEAVSKAMIEAFDGLIYVCSPNYEVEFMNERFIQRTGRNATGEKCYEAIHDLKEACPWCVNERVQNGETVRWEVQSPKDSRWYYVVNTPVRHRDGTISKMAVIQDVTERKQAEDMLKRAKDELEIRVHERTVELESTIQRLEKEISSRKETEAALRESEQRFRAIFENHHVVMLIIDPETGRIEDSSPAACTFYGYSRDDLRNKRISDINTLTPEQVVERLQMAKSQQHRYFDFQHRLASGEVRDVEVCTGPIVIGGKTFLFSVINDVTEHKQAQESLARANQEWERTFNAFSDLVMVLDSQHKIVRANRSMVKAFGMREQDMIGRNCFDLVHGAKEPPSFCPHSQLLANGEAHSAEISDPRLGGTFEVRVAPVMNQDGKLIGSVHIIRNISARKQMEEALKQSESTLKSVLQAAPVGIGLISNRTFKWSNEFLSQMTGYPQEELLGQSTRILYENDEEFERVGAIKYSQARAIGTANIEGQWKKKDGTVIDVIEGLTPLDLQNPSAGFVFAALDVTNRKRAEQALRESVEQYRAVFENAGIGINVVDLGHRKLTQANPALLNMLGYTEEELWQLTHLDITYPEDREITKQHLDGLAAGEFDSFRLEKRYIKKDGSTIWGQLSVSTIWDAKGKPRAAVGMIADITEYKRMEIALKDSEKRLRLIIDSSPIGIRISQDGNYVYVNPTFIQMFGYETKDEILGLPVDSFYAPESKDLILQRRLERHAGKKPPSYYEAVGLTKAGKRLDLAARTTDVNYFGSPARLAFIMDVTESKSLRSQLLQSQKMEAIGTLAGGIAHDFNNLLTVILGYSDLIISEKQEGAKEYEDLKKIIHAARTAGDMVQQILAFSRKSETRPRPININKQVEQLKKMLSRLIPKTIQVEISLDSGLPTVNADPAQVEQVLMNLAVNARDAMPNGGRLLIETQTVLLDEKYCSFHIEASKGPHALLVVSDTGIGIDRTTMGRIFEPFYTTKKPGQGTGLGLAMVYGIVKSHGGHITCESEPGRGTTFRTYLPAHEVEGDAVVNVSSEFSALGTGTILLADDEEFVRQLGQRILEKAGYTVITATNGQEAIDIYKEKGSQISLVILDLIMPVMDGTQCLEEILKLDPKARVLIASGYSADGRTKETIEGGAKGFVNKPYNIKLMLQAVRDALDSE